MDAKAGKHGLCAPNAKRIDYMENPYHFSENFFAQ
jgi:hypothetical protein